ncbi:hypothetical protein KJ761_00200 [Patescibacteria group bacterium]|nr:hypothetical protein [Patescibacteria group bacterium]
MHNQKVMESLIRHSNKILDEAWDKQVNTPTKFRTIEIHGKTLEVWRASGCQWNRVLFIINDQEVYNLKRMALIGPSGDNFRQEYFKGKLVRKYDGWQNCFVEFCGQLDCQVFPKEEDFARAAESLKLSANVAGLYQVMYREMFEKNV